MNIETICIEGFEPAMRAMRNPMNSWSLSDSRWTEYVVGDDSFGPIYEIGKKDKDLSLRLQKSGPEHCKHLRMIMAWADITASLTWWKQFDTYRAGVEKVSTSTMHKLMSKKLTTDDFEACNGDCYSDQLINTIDYINSLIEKYNNETNPEAKKAIWECAIQILPQSYLQKRTVMMSYAALRNIIKQREGHKLDDWHQFILWAKDLMNSWMIFDE